MNDVTFGGKSYKRMDSSQCITIFDITDNIKLGEYAEYGDKYLFKTDTGIIAAYKEDLSNYWEI